MPHDGWDGYFGALIFFTALQWGAALGRFGTRIGIVKRIGPDDIALFITLLFSSAFDGCAIAIQVLSGGGRASYEVEPDNLLPAVNTTLGAITAYPIGALCLKISLGLLLLRVLVRPWQVWVIYGVMGLNVLYGVGFFFLVLFQCGSPDQFALKIITGQCLSVAAIDGVSYSHSVLNALSDLVFGVLPVFLICQTKMSIRSKTSVGGILCLGSIGVVATIVRVGYVNTLSKATDTYFITAKPIALLSAAELSIGITCVSICTYRPFFHRLFGNHSDQSYDDEARTKTRETQQMQGTRAQNEVAPEQNLASSQGTVNYLESGWWEPVAPGFPATELVTITPVVYPQNWPILDDGSIASDASPTSPISTEVIKAKV